MVEPTLAEDDIEQRIRDAQEKFNAGMGADGAASPYPLLRELRAKGAVHPGWVEMGIPPAPAMASTRHSRRTRTTP